MDTPRTYAVGDVIGAVLLIAALFVLGFFNFKSDTPLVEAGLSAEARGIVAESVHEMQVSVEGRDIMLSGLADSAAEKDAIIKALRGIDGRGKIRSRVTVLGPMAPFAFSATRRQGGAYSFAGSTPTERFREELRQVYGEGAGALTLAAGAPEEDWAMVATAGLRALEALETGRLEMQDRALSLSGEALTPQAAARAEQLLSDLPESYSPRTHITALDDGSPPRLTAARTEGEMQPISAKLPQGMDLAGLDGEIALSPLPLPVAGWDSAVRQALGALESLHNGDLAIIDTSLTLTGDAWSEEDYHAVQSALEAMPRGMFVSSRITLADSGSPFGLRLTRAGQAVRAEGKVPQSLAPPVLSALTGGPVAAEALEVVGISPGERWWQAASLGAEVVKQLESGEVAFDGRAMVVRGRVQDPPALAQLERHFEALPYGIALDLQVNPIDDGTPLRLRLSFDGASAALNGKLPEGWRADMLADWLGVPVLVEDMVQTPKAGPEGWATAAENAVRALALFESGALTLSGQDISLSGVLLSPARERELLAALEALPEGYRFSTRISFQDDGRPFGFRLFYDGAEGVLSGKVPSDLGPASQSAILGAPVTAEALGFAGIPADAEWWSAARAGVKALAVLREGELQLDAYRLRLTGRAGTQEAVEAVRARLAPFQEGFSVTIEIVTE